MHESILTEVINLSTAKSYDIVVPPKEQWVGWATIKFQADFTTEDGSEFSFRVILDKPYGKHAYRIFLMKKKSTKYTQNLILQQGSFKKTLVTFLKCYDLFKDTNDGKRASSIIVMLQPGVKKYATLFHRAITLTFKNQPKRKLELIGVDEEGKSGVTDLFYISKSSVYPYFGGKLWDEEKFKSSDLYLKLSKKKDGISASVSDPEPAFAEPETPKSSNDMKKSEDYVKGFNVGSEIYFFAEKSNFGKKDAKEAEKTVSSINNDEKFKGFVDGYNFAKSEFLNKIIHMPQAKAIYFKGVEDSKKPKSKWGNSEYLNYPLDWDSAPTEQALTNAKDFLYSLGEKNLMTKEFSDSPQSKPKPTEPVKQVSGEWFFEKGYNSFFNTELSNYGKKTAKDAISKAVSPGSLTNEEEQAWLNGYNKANANFINGLLFSGNNETLLALYLKGYLDKVSNIATSWAQIYKMPLDTSYFYAKADFDAIKLFLYRCGYANIFEHLSKKLSGKSEVDQPKDEKKEETKKDFLDGFSDATRTGYIDMFPIVSDFGLKTSVQASKFSTFIKSTEIEKDKADWRNGYEMAALHALKMLDAAKKAFDIEVKNIFMNGYIDKKNGSYSSKIEMASWPLTNTYNVSNLVDKLMVKQYIYDSGRRAAIGIQTYNFLEEWIAEVEAEYLSSLDDEKDPHNQEVKSSVGHEDVNKYVLMQATSGSSKLQSGDFALILNFIPNVTEKQLADYSIKSKNVVGEDVYIVNPVKYPSYSVALKHSQKHNQYTVLSESEYVSATKIKSSPYNIQNPPVVRPNAPEIEIKLQDILKKEALELEIGPTKIELTEINAAEVVSKVQALRDFFGVTDKEKVKSIARKAMDELESNGRYLADRIHWDLTKYEEILTNSNKVGIHGLNSLISYTGQSYEAINDTLRSGDGSENVKGMIENIDKVFKKKSVKLKGNIEVYRGGSIRSEDLVDLQNGKTYEMTSYSSCSFAPHIAFSFSKAFNKPLFSSFVAGDKEKTSLYSTAGNKVVMSINQLYNGYSVYVGHISNHTSEFELILNRGTQVKLRNEKNNFIKIADSMNDPEKGLYHLKVKVVGQGQDIVESKVQKTYKQLILEERIKKNSETLDNMAILGLFLQDVLESVD